MARHKDGDWNIPRDAANGLKWEHANLAVLMDIRDELQKLNRVFACPNFLAVPAKLDAIAKNTTKPRRRRRAISR